MRISELSISGKADNFFQKHLATVKFYKTLISERLYSFSLQQRLQIMRKYENEIQRERKLTMGEWNFLFYNYLYRFKFYSFKKFVKRAIKSYMNKK